MRLVVLSVILGLVHGGSVSHAGGRVGQASKKISIGSYNVENLFDTIDDEGKDDVEYTPDGKAKWTEKKLALKIDALARVIRTMNDGKGPDVLGLSEVENLGVLQRLADKLSDLGYKAVLAEGFDERGIDNGILTRLPVVGSPKVYRVDNPQDPRWSRPTRPVTVVTVQAAPGVDLAVALNHWPSQAHTEDYRCDAAKTLKQAFKDFLGSNPAMRMVAVGDFNEDPDHDSMKNCLGVGNFNQVMNSQDSEMLIYNPNLDNDQLQTGSYYYARESRWNKFDNVLMSKNLLTGANFQYVKDSFHRVQNDSNSLKHPFRNGKKLLPPGAPIPFSVCPCNGTRGEESVGASDHLPVEAAFTLN